MTPKAKVPLKTLPGEKHCQVKDCGRPGYSSHLCQTHHRQFVSTGKLSSIRPYRARDGDTVKFAGLRLRLEVVVALKRISVEQRFSHSASIAHALEMWLLSDKKR